MKTIILKDIYFNDSKYRKISKSLILNITKARLDEIISLLKKQLIAPGFNLTSGITLFLTGGGSKLLNLDKYFINFFGSNIKIEPKNSIDKNKNLEKDFSPCLGALKIIKDGWETEAIPEKGTQNIKKVSFFDKFFKINK